MPRPPLQLRRKLGQLRGLRVIGAVKAQMKIPLCLSLDSLSPIWVVRRPVIIVLWSQLFT